MNCACSKVTVNVLTGEQCRASANIRAMTVSEAGKNLRGENRGPFLCHVYEISQDGNLLAWKAGSA